MYGAHVLYMDMYMCVCFSSAVTLYCRYGISLSHWSLGGVFLWFVFSFRAHDLS